ncbi:MAG: DNA-processing protein DprA [Candidatus Omnitrophica bacterium]|nr:DNA-processing protein DprA [Candidatus Omnitrophota bacterium]
MKIVEIKSLEYPCLLRQINDPPEKLYCKGSWDANLFNNCLAVVGSRRMTVYGKQITNELVSKIALSGITIVSGFMYGVDAQAHKAALSVGGKTIAVMPCGIDLIHPGHQKDLYEQIIAEGSLIISEFERNFPPARWTYPKRNRIVAGLSQATLVIEGSSKSGTLITAEFAKKFKRKLFAVPGPLTSSLSQATSQLIKEGASLVADPDDVLGYYGLSRSKDSANPFLESNLSELEKDILKKLRQEPKEFDALCRLTKISASKLGTVISFMLLKGLVEEESGKYYVSKSRFSA